MRVQLADSALTEAERRFFGELDRLGVRYLIDRGLLQGPENYMTVVR